MEIRRKVLLLRRWRGKVPKGADGQPIPRTLWPRRRECVWIVRWYSVGASGKVRRPSRRFAERADAERFRDELQVTFDQSPAARKEPKKVTLREFIDEFDRLRIGPRGQALKPRSVTQVRQSLERFAAFIGEDRRLADITTSDAARYFAALREKNGPATVNFRKRTLRAAFGVGVRQLGYLKENPFRAIATDRVMEGTIRFVAPPEFAALLAACESEQKPLWWKAVLLVAYTAGLRLSEILHLTWADVDFEAEVIRVSAKTSTKTTIAWTPKDYESRIIPTPSVTMTELTKLQEKADGGQVYCFIPPERIAFIKAAQEAGTWSDDRFMVNNLHRRMPRIVARAAKAVPSLLDSEERAAVSFHDLRRSALTTWSRTTNVQTVSKLAGHSDVATTMKYYLGVTPDQIDAARRASADALAAALGGSANTDEPRANAPQSAATDDPSRQSRGA